MRATYIIVAGGVGSRMGSSIPKQYIEVFERPIIYYTVKKLVDLGVKKLILVIDLSYQEYLAEFFQELDADIKYVAGGSHRQESVLNGLKAVEDDCEVVAIHDSVRPLVTLKMLDDLENKIREEDIACVIPVLAVKDTIKEVMGQQVVKTIDRSNLFKVGTPQYIKIKEYYKALEVLKDKKPQVTDDASIMELAGLRVGIVEGDNKAFKITEQDDLKYFKYLLKEEL